MDVRLIAREIYLLRRRERRLRGLYTTPWVDLDLSLQQHWCKLVERVIELYEPPPAPPKDDGL